ncbi:tetratricopeptide repeat protein [Alkalihalobacillus oceani]|uniref:tetratricopeptide repeat protein n=1 Tax=Halalkalibacter oceani TaxID=1653776 RepID=UPI00203D0044|nr:tetratricopeptide repeat protein [Halalkalibacter oceani]MCM3760628.1 tetratricopeptide repeat protein [Halalkalibacter oceani]
MDVTPQNEQNKRKVVPLYQNGDYFFQRGLEAYRKNHLQKAVRLFERAVKLTAQEPVFRIQLAAVLSELGEYERSNDILHDVLNEKGDKLAECYFFMANNYAYLGLFEQAERATLRYLELHPNERFSSDAYELLDLLRFEREEDDDWEELDAQEDELVVRHEYAHRLLRKGEIQSSIPILQAIINDHPTCWAAHNHLAEALFRQGEERAFAICEAVLEKDKGNLIAICNLALFYTEKGDAKQADHYIRALKNVYPLQEDHYMKIAETLCAVGHYQEAYERLKELQQWQLEQRPALLFCYAVALAHVGEEKKAKQLIERAARLSCRQAEQFLQSGLLLGELRYQIWAE